MKGNAVFWGKAEDAIANNLFKNYTLPKSPLPGMMANVGQNPDKPLPSEKSNRRSIFSSLWDGAKFLLGQAWEHKGDILSAASSIAPMLLAKTPIDDEEQPDFESSD